MNTSHLASLRELYIREAPSVELFWHTFKYIQKQLIILQYILAFIPSHVCTTRSLRGDRPWVDQSCMAWYTWNV